jgi:hypothetical protein
MRGRLPETIRIRPKTPFRGEPLLAALRHERTKPLLKMQRAEQFEHYIDEGKVPSLAGEMSFEEAELGIRPICLNFWLLSLSRKDTEKK